MLREVLIVALGVWLALFVRTLFLAALWNTKELLDTKLKLCMKCGDEHPTLLISYAGEQRQICEVCARQDFAVTFEEALQRGILKKRPLSK